MKKLKQCCRTCRHLYPTTYVVDCYDYEENYYTEKYPCNCDEVENYYDVNVINHCRLYEPVDESFLYKEV